MKNICFISTTHRDINKHERNLRQILKILASKSFFATEYSKSYFASSNSHIRLWYSLHMLRKLTKNSNQCLGLSNSKLKATCFVIEIIGKFHSFFFFGKHKCCPAKCSHCNISISFSDDFCYKQMDLQVIVNKALSSSNWCC